jgi:hypothetical protein
VPGGPCTNWKAPPFHGARQFRAFIALNAGGEKEILGLWIEQTEGAKFWLKVLNDLRNRGVGDMLIAVVDGLKGFPVIRQALLPHPADGNVGRDLDRRRRCRGARSIAENSRSEQLDGLAKPLELVPPDRYAVRCGKQLGEALGHRRESPAQCGAFICCPAS